MITSSVLTYSYKRTQVTPKHGLNLPDFTPNEDCTLERYFAYKRSLSCIRKTSTTQSNWPNFT